MIYTKKKLLELTSTSSFIRLCISNFHSSLWDRNEFNILKHYLYFITKKRQYVSLNKRILVVLTTVN